MRSATLLLMLVLGGAACAEEEEITHGDPPCAFDETGCIPSELVFDVRTGTDEPTAVLRASSATESWTQRGVRASGSAIVIPSGELGRVAPRAEISLAGDAHGAKLRIHRIGADGELEVVEGLTLDPTARVVRLTNDRYLLELRVPGSDGLGRFLFVAVVP